MTRPQPPLLPADAAGRARVRALAQVVGCDIHPLGNLRVLQHLVTQFGADDSAKGVWSRHWIGEGFRALETMLAGDVATGRFCHGDMPTLADACLVPQVYNAVRWKLPMDDYPTIWRVYDACQALEAFRQGVIWHWGALCAAVVRLAPPSGRASRRSPMTGSPLPRSSIPGPTSA